MLWPIKIDKVKGEEITREGGKESGRRGRSRRKRGRGAFVGRKGGREAQHVSKFGLLR